MLNKLVLVALGLLAALVAGCAFDLDAVRAQRDADWMRSAVGARS